MTTAKRLPVGCDRRDLIERPWLIGAPCPSGSYDGDMAIIQWALTLTPAERLEVLQNHLIRLYTYVPPDI